MSKSIKRIIKRIIFNVYLNKFADLITVNSEYLKSNVIDNYNIEKNKISIIYNCIDTEKLKVKETPFKKKGFCIGTIGRIAEVKRIDRLLKAYSFLKNSFPDSYENTSLLIIGKGAVLEDLKNQAKVLGIYERTNFTGFVDEINEYRAKLDLFVISSGSRDSFPLTFLEAMYCKIPVVCFEDSGGVPEVLKHYVNGFIIKTEDELGNFFHDFINLDKHTIQKIVDNAHKDVIDNFTISKYARQYNQKYRFIMQKYYKEVGYV